MSQGKDATACSGERDGDGHPIDDAEVKVITYPEGANVIAVAEIAQAIREELRNGRPVIVVPLVPERMIEWDVYQIAVLTSGNMKDLECLLTWQCE